MITEKIRKQIAWIMACIMLFSICPINVLADGAQKSKGIPSIGRTNKWINERLEVKELLNQKFNLGLTGIELDITLNGTYELEYYILNNLKPTKIEMTLEVDSEKVNVTTKLKEEVSSYIDKKYRRKDLINDSWPVGNVLTGEVSTLLLKKVQAPYIDRGAIVGIEGESLEIRYIIDAKDPNKFILTTNGIEKGNITPFTLRYEGNLVEKIEVLEEMAHFKSEAIHLKDSLNSVINLVAPDQAGAKPGMKIQFKHPQEINENTLKFEDMKNGESLRFKLNVVDYKQSDIQINTSFATSEEVARIEGKNESGKKLYDGTTKLHTIYLVQEEPMGLAQTTIKWDELGKSRIMEKVEIFIPFTSHRLQNMQFLTQEKAYTYLGFWIERTSETEAVIKYTPYQGLGNTEILYTVYQDGNVVGVANNSQSNTIPVPFMKEGTQEYRIEVQVFGEAIHSQILTYEAYKDVSIPPPTPQIENINNVYAIPSLDKQKQPQAIGFDVEWTAPAGTTTGGALDILLDGGNLYYEMFLYQESTTPEKGRVYSKVFEVSKDNSGKILVKPYVGEAGKDEIEGDLRYKVDTNTFIMENVKVKSETSESKWNRLQGIPGDYKLLMDYPTNLTEQATLGFTVPNTYYVTMRAVYDKKGSTEQLTVSKESNPMPISIDETREIVPSVSHIISENNTVNNNNISQNITLTHSDLSKYYERMLRPASWNLWKDIGNKDSEKYRRTYQIFLYQKNEHKESYIEADFDFSSKEDLFIEYDPLDSNKDSIELTAIQKEELRKGEIIPIKVVGLDNRGKTSMPINNLDPNQVYYIQVKVKVEPWRNLNGKDEEYVEYSLVSGVHSFTTYTSPIPPSPDEQVPPTPSKFWIGDQPNNTSVTLGWLEPDYELPQGSTVYYELARIQDNELKQMELERTLSIEELLNLNNKVIGFRNKGEFLEKKLSSTKSWEFVTPSQSSARLRLQDVTLAPNVIYYYYVRTVVVIKGKEVNSEWIMLPVTTEPISKPIKLKVEHPEDYKYDLTDEVVVSFLAPIPKDAKVPEEYDFDIAVKGEKDEDYKLDYSKTRLTSKEKNTPDEYVHMVYRIDGLRAGNRYDIKVRGTDKTKEKPNGGEYPKSLYSNRVQYRTEYNEEDQNQEDKFEEYLKQYENEAEKLKRKPYWEVKDNTYSRHYKYRMTYMESEFLMNKNYPLVSEGEIKSYYYYFPAQMIYRMNEIKAMLIATLPDTTITIRPETITAKTREIEDTLMDIKKDKIDDYYIALEIRARNTNKFINGQIPLSPEIFIDLHLVKLNDKDIYIEEKIIDELNELIDEGREDIIAVLEREIKYGEIRDEKIESAIQEIIETIQKDHAKEVAYILNRTIKDTDNIGEINRLILLTYNKSAYGINGYYLGRTWESIYTFATGKGYAIEAEKLGTYIFLGNNRPISPEISTMQDLVGKYQLTDFFEVDNKGLEKSATKGDVIGALARILGAKRGSDYVIYLQNRGIKGLTTTNIDKSIRQDEAIYLLMQGYEKIHFKPIQSIYIKNKQSVQNIGAFQPHYRDYIYPAVELGIVKPINYKVLPSQVMTAKDIINMLSKIVPK